MGTLCRLDCCVYTARFYANEIDPEASLKDQSDYICTATVSIQGGIAMVWGASGMLTIKSISAFYDEIRSHGATSVIWERHKDGKIKTIHKIL